MAMFCGVGALGARGQQAGAGLPSRPGEQKAVSRTARPEAYSAVQRAVGTRMVWVREALDIRLTEAARLMGVHISPLAKIESGDRAASIFNVIEFSVRF